MLIDSNISWNIEGFYDFWASLLIYLDIKLFPVQIFKKLSLGSYRWQSYNETHVISTNMGKGLRELGQLPRTSIAIYAETRAEWIMSAFGAFSQGCIFNPKFR